MKILISMMLGVVCAVNACKQPMAKTETTSTATSTASKDTATAPKATTPTASPNLEKKNYMVTLHTDFGDMKIKLYDETPLHRDNFMKNVEEGFYDGTLFHRVIAGFMIQGGDPTSKGAAAGQQLGMGSKNNPPQRVPYEFNPSFMHKKGALAAARDGNPQKASSDCQFYIVQGKKMTDAEIDQNQMMNSMKYTPEQREILKTQGGTPMLDNGYTVFGEVIEGIDILDKIAATETDRQLGDRPKKDVKMTIKKN